jgi:hypothetical protein
MKHRNKYKAKITEWKNDIFTTVEKFFSTEDEAKEETEKHFGQGKVYDEKGHPVYNKPEKPQHPKHPDHPDYPEHPDHPYC